MPGTPFTKISISIWFGFAHASVTGGFGKVYLAVQTPRFVLMVRFAGQVITGGTLSTIRISWTCVR